MDFTFLLISIFLLIAKNSKCEVTLSTLMPIDGPCTPDIKCVVGSACIDSKCTCPIKFVPCENLLCCLQIRDKEGEVCEESQQCTKGALDKLSECTLLKCQCKQEAVIVPGLSSCLPKAFRIGDECIGVQQCENLGTATDVLCDKLQCKCNPETSVDKKDGLMCIPIVNEIGKSCEQTDQCQKGTSGSYSVCSKDTCQCQENAVYHGSRGKCLLKASYGDACEETVQCVTALGDKGICQKKDSSLIEGICNCTNGFVISEDHLTCLSIVDKIGELCKENVQCTSGLPGDFSECVKNPITYDWQCQCTSAAIQMPGEQICFKIAEKLNEACKYNEQCANLGTESICVDEVCGCSPGFVGNTNENLCIEGPLLIGSPCMENVQCIENSKCSESGHCGCEEDFIHSQTFDRCLQIRQLLGDPCEEPNQCQHGKPGEYSNCFEYPGGFRCNCTSEAVAVVSTNECLKKAEHVGDNCTVQDQCLISLGHSECASNSTCVCQRDWSASFDKTECVLSVSLGDNCNDHGQCSQIPDSASCQMDPDDVESSKICICNIGYDEPPSSGKCYRRATAIGESCDRDDYQCVHLNGSKCMYGGDRRSCLCNYVTEVVSHDGTKCLPQVDSLYASCEESQQCKRNNSRCNFPSENSLTKECICSKGFVESEILLGNCINIVTEMDQVCSESIQCLAGIGDHTECFNGHCECEEKYVPFNKTCQPQLSLGEYCETNTECQAGINLLAHCNLTFHECQCRPDAVVYMDSCYMSKAVGDECSSDDECMVTIVGDILCDKNALVCRCRDGSVSQFDGRLCGNSASSLMKSGLLFWCVLYTYFM